jgi:hypothetical protein
MPLDLLVPDLLSPDSASPRLRSLEKWLARADIERDAAGGLAWLARAFGMRELPVAAIERSADPAPGAWMRADPVHLRIQGDAVHLYDSSALQVTQAEAHELIEALQSHFASDGLEFTAPSPDRWYVRMPAGEAPRTTPRGEGPQRIRVAAGGRTMALGDDRGADDPLRARGECAPRVRRQARHQQHVVLGRRRAA